MVLQQHRDRLVNRTSIVALIVFLSFATKLAAQEQKTLLLSEAIATGINNYQRIKAKRNYLNASTALIQDEKNRYLPNVIASVQQAYGTINGQYGPLIAAEGMGLASAGPITSSQRSDAAFGALYLINTNWEFFTFGRIKSRIERANAAAKKDSADLLQEEFVQSVKVAGAYLNLLAAKRLYQNAEANLQRAMTVQQTVLARTKSGLNPGVDSSIVNAEVSRAKLVVIDARNNEQQFSYQLAQLLNISADSFSLDTTFLVKVPSEVNTATTVDQNPQVKFFQTRIDESNSTVTLLKKSILPGFYLFGIYQTRASGFDYNYNAANNFPYSKNYFDGIKPARSNYVAGVAIAWNIISPLKIKQQVRAQQFITDAYKDEYDQVSTQLKNESMLADKRIENSLQTVQEAPLQRKAAADAYLQKSVLYKNGLTDIVDLQQALFALNRAETDMNVAFINVWQALLLKSAASGDFELFRKQVQ